MTFGHQPHNRPDRIAVTGLGVICAAGSGIHAYWSALSNGVSGISQIERFSTQGLRVGRGGEVKEDRVATLPSVPKFPHCRASRFLIRAASQALEMAHWETAARQNERLGVVVGTALGGIEAAEELVDHPRDLRALASATYESPTRQLARWANATGPVMTVSTACASGATSLGIGADLLKAGTATAVLAGGVDILCRFVLTGFNRLRSLTRDEVRPFDLRRRGLLLGEGAGMVLMERESIARQREVRPFGFVRGHASCTDGTNIVAPDDGGRGLESSIRLAMQEANVTPKDIDFISAHGTGTLLNDRVETAVFKKVLETKAYAIPINSIKAYIGHTMGAAGTLETIMCFLAAHHGQVPATLNYSDPDPSCDLDYVPTQRQYQPHIMLKTALGFAGSNACLVLEGNRHV